MHWKLFFTIVAGIVASYFVIRWVQSEDSLADQSVETERRPIGFHAIRELQAPQASV